MLVKMRRLNRVISVDERDIQRFVAMGYVMHEPLQDSVDAPYEVDEDVHEPLQDSVDALRSNRNRNKS